ncbi:hypothetical protein PVL29_024538 [Vitis rotundifolia]|uniref:ADP-ribosyl cyclase/cyclic ADP-ribose hydrolase n=1 Tax=Vitis rotundifolia TaxID=103349 RepID=A0AA39D8E0_VITRO|nr:hypothetical protein PVL29_024538 [Vitis rotundifolia]
MASASTSTHEGIYDVFLSFRGETRYHFTDHLYSALRDNGVHTFRDDEELERGDVIAPGLLKAIEQSRISIVIFSENYAQSRWCLDELVKIIECMTERKQIVLPVFYHVDPSHVRKQMGSYGEAFAYHEKDADLKKREKIQKWRTALTETSNLSGWHLLDNQSESNVIKEITDKIITRLNPRSLYVGKNIVGMNIRLEKLLSLINIDSNDVCFVGICGLGGIGKTTIAKALYNKISNQFQGASFLANVRENSEKHSDILQLQRQLLDDIEKGKNRKISNVHEGMDAIKKVLSLGRVLVVLDDVDNFEQLKHFAGEHDWFGPGSRILITTRNKHLLHVHGVDKYHEIEELNSEEALQLFSLYAFKPNCHQEDYEDLPDRIVKYAKGLPLALRVLGSHLCERTPSEWESELHKLEREPIQEIQNVLKISYDGLDRTQGEIFLDIACFFKGQDKDFVSRILDGCDFYAESGFSVLCDRCLITILDNKIHMHDLIQQMGWHIVREQNPEKPGKWSRLWEREDVFRVLTRYEGTEAIKGIFLDMSTSKQLQFTTEAFKMMNDLRLLKVHQDANYDSAVKYWTLAGLFEMHLSQVHFCRDFKFPSQELRYLHWDGYPLESLPSNFYAENLVELNLRCSNIKQLWETELFKKLKVINLSHSQHLNKIPNPSSVPNLEILTLEGCINLESLPRSIYKLRRLTTLCCGGCKNLRSFPEIMGNMEKLRKLDLDNTAIVKLPSSIEHLKGLEYLDLSNCKDLITIPQSICNLTSLKFLNFDFCSKLEKLPEDLKSLKCLQKLYLQDLNCQLPSVSGLCSLKVLNLSESNVTDKGILINICHLSSLEELYLNNCNLMGEIPSEVCQLSSLKELDLSWNHFSSIPASISQLSKLKALGLSHCRNLLQIPELPSTLQFLDAHNSHFTLSSPSSFLPSSFSEFQDLVCGSSFQLCVCYSYSYFEEGVSIFFPGISGIPEWIMGENMGNHVTIDLPQDWFEDKDFLGFALCSAYVPLDDESKDDFEHGFEDKSEIQSENESDHDEWAHKSEDESENGSAYKFDNKYVYEHSPCSLECDLTFHGDQSKFSIYPSLSAWCECCENDGASGQMWVLYYPKFAIKKNYHSNTWGRLKASFHGYFNGMPVKVEKCGVQLIYAKNDEYNCPTLTTMPDTWNMECLQKLYLDGTAIKEIPSSIDSLSILVEFYTRNCKNLESLPRSICRLKYLQVLCCSGCSKLGSFPELMENMNNLRELHLHGTAIQDLPSSIENLKGLKFLDLASCKKLVTLPTHICNLKSLKTLHVYGCSKLNKLPKSLGSLQCLEHLDAGCLGSIASQLPSLSGLCSLRILHLNGLNLMQWSIQDDICRLYSLEVLDLTNCNLIDDGIADEIFHLSSLQVLLLSRNHISKIPAGISQLSKLQVLGFSHCKMAVEIPELPSSLRSIDVHACTGLKILSNPSSLFWASLFKCFKSAIQVLYIFMALDFVYRHGIYMQLLCRIWNVEIIAMIHLQKHGQIFVILVKELVFLFQEVVEFQNGYDIRKMDPE